MAGINISWHMDGTAHALADETSSGGGVLKIGVDERCLHYPNLDIYMPDASRARLAAAALNGELADEGASMTNPVTDAIEVLQLCEEYFDRRADVDCQDDRWVPNEEKILLDRCARALDGLGNKKPSGAQAYIDAAQPVNPKVKI